MVSLTFGFTLNIAVQTFNGLGSPGAFNLPRRENISCAENRLIGAPASD